MGLELFDENITEIVCSRASELVNRYHADDSVKGRLNNGESFELSVGSFIELPEYMQDDVFSIECKGKQITELCGIKTKYIQDKKIILAVWLINKKDSRDFYKCIIREFTSSYLIQLYKNALEVIDNDFRQRYYKKALLHSRKCDLLN